MLNQEWTKPFSLPMNSFRAIDDASEGPRCCMVGVVIILGCLIQSERSPGQEESRRTDQTVPSRSEGSVKTTVADDLLWAAARRGDLKGVKSAIGNGVPVDAKTVYGATALSFAADRGHLEVVRFLLSHNANVDVKDSFYQATPMAWASSGDHYEIMKALVGAGASEVDGAFRKGIVRNDQAFLGEVLATGKVSGLVVRNAVEFAKKNGLNEIQTLLEDYQKTRQPKFRISPETLKTYTGSYRNPLGKSVELIFHQGVLMYKSDTGQSTDLTPLAERVFSLQDAELHIQKNEEMITGFEWVGTEKKESFKRLTPDEIAKSIQPKPADKPAKPVRFPSSSSDSKRSDLAVSSSNWGQFRGNGARGIADGQGPPIQWNVSKKNNLLWKIPIPGLGHGCPVIWNGRIFVTSAVSENDLEIRTGLYGDVASVDDDSEHRFVTYCLDAETGSILWQQTACRRVPQVKRHLKSTHANSTVATNGEYVVAWFGSEGIYCYTMQGELVWKKDLGRLDSGWFYDRDYQWQFGASPIIHQDCLILQCDIQDQSFITSLELGTGKELWRTERNEIPSWSTPTVIDSPAGTLIVTNATQAARGYDFETGKEIWSISNNSEIAVPTPFVAHNLIYVSSGYRPVQPIYAIRLDAKGDLTLESDMNTSEYLAWSTTRGGPYMPTPIVYGDYLYVCSNSGILTCYQATTGEQVYKKRLKMKGGRSFVGSPVAADGFLYFTSEEGETAVVKAGPEYELTSHCFCDENCLTTPAISNGVLYLRGQKHVFAFQKGNNSNVEDGE